MQLLMPPRAFLLERKAALVLNNPSLARWFIDLNLSHINLEDIKQCGLPPPEDNRVENLYPFLSIRAFKHHKICLHPEAETVRTFLSSGSTASHSQSMRGAHALTTVGLTAYEYSAAQGFANFLKHHGFAEKALIISLVPRSNEWLDSSLAEMLEIFQRSGHDVHWAQPEDLYKTLQATEHHEETVIFGTSFHHVQTAHHKNTQGLAPGPKSILKPEKRKILVIDTGGTKGRTLVFADEKMRKLLQYCYQDFGTLKIASEYGMCELSSQAYTFSVDHAVDEPLHVQKLRLRDFRCAPTLLPLLVDPVTHEVTFSGTFSKKRTSGFLAFIDAANLDSYPAILTEDIGESLTTGLRDFRLLGRAPMANIKGCSLRTSGVFQGLPQILEQKNPGLSENEPESISQLQHSKSDLHKISFHLEEIPSDLFTVSEAKALRDAFASAVPSALNEVRDDVCHSTLSQDEMQALFGHFPSTLLILASANVPVTFIYPVFAAMKAGFTRAEIYLPSIRDDDPLSGHVRAQIDWILGLISTIAQTKAFEIFCAPAESGIPQTGTYHTVIVFGTDQTTDLFKNYFSGRCLRYLAFGEFENFARASDYSPTEIAELCLSWKGRGCLTPRGIIFDSVNTLTQNEYIEKFASHFQCFHAQEFSGFSNVLGYFHWHDRLELEAKLGDSTRYFSTLGTLIVDLTHEITREYVKEDLDFAVAGQGLVFLLRQDQFERLHKIEHIKSPSRAAPSFNKICPLFNDAHMGKTWSEWLAVSDKE